MRMPRPQGHVSRLLRPEARVVLTLPPSYVFCLTNVTAAKITKRQQTTCDAGARIGGSGTALSTGSHRRFGTSKTSPSSKGLTLVPLPFRRFGPFSTLTPFPGHDTFFGLVSLPSNVPRTHDKRERTKKKMTAGPWRKRTEALFLKIPRTKFLARMTRLNRLSKRYGKEPQDISKSIVKILMPFHPPLNHDVYNHMEKIQPIL